MKELIVQIGTLWAHLKNYSKMENRIEFKDKIRVRCLECQEEHFIEMKHISTEKEQRSISFEYEYIFRGELKCSHCGEEMRLLTTVFEYPKGIINYIDNCEESCISMEEINEDLLLFKPITQKPKYKENYR